MTHLTGTMRRIRAIGRAELTLLLRDGMALCNAVVPPLAIVGLAAAAKADPGGLPGNAFRVTGLLGLVLVGAVYFTLVGTYVARRERLVLKRLRVGEITDVEILTGTASPAIVLALAQIVVFTVAGAVFLGLPVPVNAPVLVLGALGGAGVFVLLAAASAAFTRTVELAQVTTMPLVLACLLGSGLMMPLDDLPGWVGEVVRFLPLTPAVELMRLGWLGTTGAGAPVGFVAVFAAAAGPVAILAAWAALGAVAVRRRFRWEPRR
ncbi:ABC transporter permease [Actinoplanes sp. SE50]|uniref:ABC transporter permease n=1 Tax=unclassified Actinoplanes TaxID=2626549 RepID=UPI00023EC7C7|nr:MULTISPECIES: ABC transporter permease [unclassified Actinoplanes]AEV84711.1 ABC-2 type transporter [Actinoplanes sp. SE50/110]ATO83103.1 ABC transporter permease [Actinoplanes sp. SE50]SLM00510.1 ABC-type transporter, permease component [Actinoplanes sp. SE50/110]